VDVCTCTYVRGGEGDMVRWCGKGGGMSGWGWVLVMWCGVEWCVYMCVGGIWCGGMCVWEGRVVGVGSRGMVWCVCTHVCMFVCRYVSGSGWVYM